MKLLGIDVSDQQFENTSNAPNLDSLNNFLFIGDSITVGLQNSGQIKASGVKYAAVVSKDAGYWRSNLDTIYNTAPSNMQGICIMLGVNNLSDHISTEKLIQILHGKYPKVPIYVQKVLPVNDTLEAYKLAGYNAHNDAINRYNEAIAEFCNSNSVVYNCYFIDTSEGYVDSNGLLLQTSDGLHPNNYEQLARNIENAIVNTNVDNNQEDANQEENTNEEEGQEEDNQNKNKDLEIYIGTPEENAEQMLEDLNLEEKISQMIMAIASSADDLKQDVGGYTILYDSNNLAEDIENSQSSNSIPAIYSSDDEGGEVQRVTDGEKSQRYYGKKAEEDGLESAQEELISDYKERAQTILESGINMNLAPVADLSSDNSYMGQYERSFGPDFDITSSLLEKAVQVYEEKGLISCLKHFPGYGNGQNTHEPQQYHLTANKSRVNRYIDVFKKGIEAGAPAILRSHLYYDAIDSENPAILSKEVGNIIRNDLNFDGVVITDALNMQTITKYYTDVAELAVKCVEAGNDMLMTDKVDESIQAIKQAVNSGRIDEATIDESVRRILTMKFEYGVMDTYNDKGNNLNRPGDGNPFQGAITIKRVMPNKEIGELKELEGEVQLGNGTQQLQEIKEVYNEALALYNDNGQLDTSKIANMSTDKLKEINEKFDELYEADKDTKIYYNDNNIVCKVKTYHNYIKEELKERKDNGEKNIEVDFAPIEDNKEGEKLETEATNSEGIKSRNINMRYVSPETFDGYVEANDTRALSVYTLDENKNLIIANWSYNSSTGVKIKEASPINYRSVTDKYTMPYEYLLFMYIAGEDVDFVSGLADMATGAEIIITIQDDVSTTKTDTVVTQQVQTNENGNLYVGEPYQISSQTVITETDSSKAELTYADTWFVRLEKDTSYRNNDTAYTGKNTDSGENTTSTTASSGWYTINSQTDEDGNYSSTSQNIETTTTTTTRTVSSKYDSGETAITGLDDKEDRFIALYNDCPVFQNTLVPSWLFDAMEANEKTVNLIDLTKYLLYKATGDDKTFDVTEFDFDEFKDNEFASVGSGIYGGTVEEKVWFAIIDLAMEMGANEEQAKYAAAGVLGNFSGESGFKTNCVQGDYKKPDPEEYNRAYTESVDTGQTTRDQFVNHGPGGGGYGLAQWTYYSRKEGLYDYAKSINASIGDADMQIQYLIAEISMTGEAANYATPQLTARKGFTVENWINANSPEEAAEAFCWLFENPDEPHMENRKSEARRLYNEMYNKSKPADDDRIGSIELTGSDATKMMEMLCEAIRIADDDSYTYSQANRYGEFQYDCSSFVARLYKEFFDLDLPSTTYNYGNEGYIGSPSSVELQPGDILWRSEHVTLYLGNGNYVAAHGSKYPIPDQISVANEQPTSYSRVYRFVE